MDTPLQTDRERLAAINAANRAAYAADQARRAEAAAAQKSANRARLLATRQERMLATSCGHVEETGNPRAGCSCETCTRRRKTKSEQAKRNRRRAAGTIDENDHLDRPMGLPNFRAERFAKYGLTEVEYAEMLKGQDYRCAICGTDKPGRIGSRTSWAVDHDHACCPRAGSCGKCVRGLLCQSCNLGLGNFQDSIDRLTSAIAYLEQHRQ